MKRMNDKLLPSPLSKYLFSILNWKIVSFSSEFEIKIVTFELYSINISKYLSRYIFVTEPYHFLELEDYYLT